MKLVNFGHPERVGALIDSKVVDLNLAYAAHLASTGSSRPYAVADVEVPSNLHDFVKAEGALERASAAIKWVTKEGTKKTGPSGERLVSSLKDVNQRAALPSMSSRIICSAANYPDHILASVLTARKKGKSPPFGADWKTVANAAKWIATKPYWGFQKWPQNLTQDGEVVHIPSWVKYFDYECEIFAIMGKRVRNISKKEAKKAIFGYGALNDWSVRDSPGNVKGARVFDEAAGLNLNLKKNIGGVTMASTIVTADGFDPYNLKMVTKLNGELRQNGRTGDMVRNFEDIISYLSEFYDLFPGDIIAAGTCAGTAAESANTAVSVHDGDTVECSVEKVGGFKNQVRMDR